MSKKITIHSQLEKVKSDIYWTFRVPIDRDDIEEIYRQKNLRLNVMLQDQESFNCALFHDGSGNFFININKQVRKKLDLEPGDKVKLIIERDDSEFGMPVPDVLKELMEQDPEGNEVFRSLTPGKLRSLIFMIAKPKSEQLKLIKALVIFDYLKESGGELDYKELMEAFKNNRYK